MITFTKEQLIASAHARIEFAEMMLAGELEPLKERTWSIELELARIALASLEAEPVAYIFKHPAGRLFWALTDESNKGQSDVMPVYYAPVPAFVPPAIEPDYEVIKGILPTANPDEYACCISADMWNACRAAMLQGADQPQNQQQNIPENIPATQFKPVADLYGLTSPTGSETSFTFDAHGGWSVPEYVELERYQQACVGNSPVIPDGWKLVPIVPTEKMVIEGFESEPDEFFSKSEVWEAYQKMSGCEQAAHRAKLCWAAMISTAPQQEVK